MISQCLDTEAFGRVMAGSKIRDARLARQQNLRFGNFTGQESIDPERKRRFKKSLRTAGAPGDAS